MLTTEQQEELLTWMGFSRDKFAPDEIPPLTLDTLERHAVPMLQEKGYVEITFELFHQGKYPVRCELQWEGDRG